MAFGKIFGQFSLRALGKRFLKRFGSTVKRRFLRQQVERRFSRFEHLEDRSLMAVTASFLGGSLFVDVGATGDTVQIIGNSSAQGGIQLQSATLAAGQQTTFSGVTDIVVSDFGTNATGQSVIFSNASSSTRLNITGAISVLAGLENVTFSNTQTISAGSINIGATTGATTVFNTNIALTTITTSGSQTYANPVSLRDDVGLTAGAPGVSLADVNLGSNVLTITGPGTITGAITGSGGVTKSGSGTLTFSGTAANTYSGLTTVSNGQLDFSKTNALATSGNILITAGTLRMLSDGQTGSNSNVTVSGGTLDFNNTDQTVGTLSINGGTVLSGIILGTGDITVAGSLVQSGGTFIATSDTLTVNGDWSRTGGVFNPNLGEVLFSGGGLQNVRSNGTAFNIVSHAGSGTIRLVDDLTTGGIFTNSAGVFDINGRTATLNTFVLAGGTVSNSIPTAGSVRSSLPFDVQSGTISAVLANAAGAVGLNKTTGGTVTLAGVNTYTGPTSVTGGTLVINGSVNSNVTVTSPGALNGRGTVNGNVNGSGTFSPGAASPGIMTITGNFVPTGTVEFEVNSPYSSAGTDHDQYVVNGSVNLGGASLSFVNNKDNTQPTNDRVLTLIRNASAGPVTPSSNPADGSIVDVGTRKFQIFYNGGDGNDVVLDAVTPQISVTVRTSSATDIGTASISELGTETLIFTFTRDIDTGNAPILFGVGGTATFGTDYTVAGNPSSGFSFTQTSGRIEFPDGSLEVTVTVTPIKDSKVEPNETIILTVIAGSTYTVVDPTSATGTITDNSITGVKYNDLNQNGVRDPGEPGIGRVTIFLDLNNDGKLSIAEPAAVTDNFGRYTFPNLPAGVYTLREILQPGTIQTQPGTADGAYHVIVPEGPLANLNFGNDLSGANDFGDAPPSYGTTLAADGARHGRIAGFRLGTQNTDGEPDARLPLDGTGDDANGTGDEDGVVVGVLTPGQGFGGVAPAVITVRVSLGGNSAGRLHAWIDFNQNGKFDASEKIISNRLTGAGTSAIQVSVPSNAKLGTTFARFRYGYESDLGPTGAALAGEVEDYEVTILPFTPIANADVFPRQIDIDEQGLIKPNSVDYVLDVLNNDTPTAFGEPTIVAGSFPAVLASGSTLELSFQGGQQVLLYTAGPGVVGGTQETFMYRVTDGNSISEPGLVTLNISRADNVAVDDTYTFAATASGIETQLDVMENDLTSFPQPTARIINVEFVGPAGTNQTTIAINGTDQTVLDFDAPDAFRGTEIWAYTIDDNDPGDPDNGTAPATRFVTVQVVDNGINASEGNLVAAGYDAELDVQIVDSNGDPISVVTVGDEFFLKITSRDLRPGGTDDDRGVQSAYLDLLFDRDLIAPVPDPDTSNPIDAITFDPFYNTTRRGANGVEDAPSAGAIDEAGAFHTSLGMPEPAGQGFVEVFTVRMQAKAVTGGTPTRVSGDPRDAATTDITVFPNQQLENDEVFLRPSNTLTILGGGEGEFVNFSNPLDVNEDDAVSPIDALIVINTLNAQGPIALRGMSAFASFAMIDTNMDSMLSPVDALLVINGINSLSGFLASHNSSGSGGEGEGEGESDLSSDVDTSLLLAMQDGSSGSSSADDIESGAMLLMTDPSTTAADESSSASAGGGETESCSSMSDEVDASAADDLYASLGLESHLTSQTRKR